MCYHVLNRGNARAIERPRVARPLQSVPHSTRRTPACRAALRGTQSAAREPRETRRRLDLVQFARTTSRSVIRTARAKSRRTAPRLDRPRESSAKRGRNRSATPQYQSRNPLRQRSLDQAHRHATRLAIHCPPPRQTPKKLVHLSSSGILTLSVNWRFNRAPLLQTRFVHSKGQYSARVSRTRGHKPWQSKEMPSFGRAARSEFCPRKSCFNVRTRLPIAKLDPCPLSSVRGTSSRPCQAQPDLRLTPLPLEES
jgi:hypothetical protein